MPGAKSKIAAKKYFYLVGGVSVLIIFSAIILALYTIIDTDVSITYLDHSYDVNARIDRVFNSVKDAGTSQRSYFVTNDLGFREKFNTAKKNIQIEFNGLSEILDPEETRKLNLRELEDKIYLRLKFLDREELYFNEKHTINDSLKILIIEGQKIRDDIGKLIHRMKGTEASSLQDVREKTFTKSKSSLFIIVLTSGISILVLMSILFILRKEFEAKSHIEAELINSKILLQQQIEKLNISNKELERFAYVASHDLEEPLRKISTFSERIHEKLKDQKDEEVLNYLSRLSASAGRMRVLIKDLLNYSRATRSIDINESVSLTNLFKIVEEDLGEFINLRKASIQIGPLKEIKGNSTQLRQLFQNLISNALKFNDKETPVISIYGKEFSVGELRQTSWGKDSTYDWKNYYCIFVEDNGIGFSMEYLDQIFVIFQRLHGRAEYEGTGIGLAICKRIAENHGGFITAESVSGKGATFIVGLPLN